MTKPKKPKGTTNVAARRALFILEYVKDRNATQAAIRAGYAPGSAKVTGHRLLTDDNVRREIEQRTKVVEAKLEIDAAWVVRELIKNKERAMQEVPVMKFDHDEHCMVETGEYVYEGAVANRALELIGKTFGAFVDRVEDVTKLSPAEKRARLRTLLMPER